MRSFYTLLLNTFIVITKNNFVWFALVYWIYLGTRSVVSTSLVGGIYLLANSLSGIWFGEIVDKYKKKLVLIGSSLATLVFFTLALLLYVSTPVETFAILTSVELWLFVVLILAGSIAGNLFTIVLPTLVTSMVDEAHRDKANGLVGMVMGIGFSITSFASGLVLGYGNMIWVLGIALVLSIVALLHLYNVAIPEPKIEHEEEHTTAKVDIKKTLKTITEIPGLLALILFTTFNNFLGGVFMALMDAYGLSLVSVQTWGVLWGFLSFSFIFGGMYLSKKGLGKDPLKNLFRINLFTWTVCIFFTIQPSIVLLAVGIFLWMFFMPFVEATEHTIIQKVVPQKRQGRVFGFAQSVESAASPLTAFFIGPIAQFIFIPFMTTGKGVDLIGSWYGTGDGRGIALVFSFAGIIGLLVTLFAMRSRAYKMLAEQYTK